MNSLLNKFFFLVALFETFWSESFLNTKTGFYEVQQNSFSGAILSIGLICKCHFDSAISLKNESSENNSVLRRLLNSSQLETQLAYKNILEFATFEIENSFTTKNEFLIDFLRINKSLKFLKFLFKSCSIEAKLQELLVFPDKTYTQDLIQEIVELQQYFREYPGIKAPVSDFSNVRKFKTIKTEIDQSKYNLMTHGISDRQSESSIYDEQPQNNEPSKKSIQNSDLNLIFSSKNENKRHLLMKDNFFEEFFSKNSHCFGIEFENMTKFLESMELNFHSILGHFDFLQTFENIKKKSGYKFEVYGEIEMELMTKTEELADHVREFRLLNAQINQRTSDLSRNYKEFLTEVFPYLSFNDKSIRIKEFFRNFEQEYRNSGFIKKSIFKNILLYKLALESLLKKKKRTNSEVAENEVGGNFLFEILVGIFAVTVFIILK